jgi:uncharacterized membrane protein YozB (DUF420 family)
MSGFLGTRAGVMADGNLILHLLILSLIIVGFTFARKKKLEIHEKWMITAIVLVAISFVGWMAPSYVMFIPAMQAQFFAPISLLTNVHAVLGSITGIIAIWIVLRMKLKVPTHLRFRRIRGVMRTAFILWWLTFIFGLSLYLYHYVL